MRKSGACDDEKRLLYVPRKLLLLAALTGDSLKLRGGQRLGRSVSGILPLFDGEKISLEEMTERCRVVTELHEKTALLELVRHECMTADGSVQKSEFSDGTYVICDFAEQIYEIGYGS